MELVGGLPELPTFAANEELPVFGTGLARRGTGIGVAHFGGISGLEPFGTDVAEDMLGAPTGLALFGSGLESLGTEL